MESNFFRQPMKTSILAVLLTVITWRATAQGTVNFANGAAGVNAPVKIAGVGQPREGTEWQAELLLLGNGGATQRIGDPAPLQTDALTGYFFGGAVSVPGLEPGANATFRVRAFDVNGTEEAFSNPVTVTLGGDKTPPPNLIGLESWGVIGTTPELSITVAQKSVVLTWSKDFPNAAVEIADNLANPNWNSATETPQATGNTFTLTLPIAASERYFRLRLK